MLDDGVLTPKHAPHGRFSMQLGGIRMAHDVPDLNRKCWLRRRWRWHVLNSSTYRCVLLLDVLHQVAHKVA